MTRWCCSVALNPVLNMICFVCSWIPPSVILRLRYSPPDKPLPVVRGQLCHALEKHTQAHKEAVGQTWLLVMSFAISWNRAKVLWPWNKKLRKCILQVCLSLFALTGQDRMQLVCTHTHTHTLTAPRCELQRLQKQTSGRPPVRMPIKRESPHRSGCLLWESLHST